MEGIGFPRAPSPAQFPVRFQAVSYKHASMGPARVFGNRKSQDVKYRGYDGNLGELELARSPRRSNSDIL